MWKLSAAVAYCKQLFLISGGTQKTGKSQSRFPVSGLRSEPRSPETKAKFCFVAREALIVNKQWSIQPHLAGTHRGTRAHFVGGGVYSHSHRRTADDRCHLFKCWLRPHP
jgi:hypothetical protein